jgi:hypothetical protein
MAVGACWLNELHPWDSRLMSLGSYCSGTLGLTWTLGEGQRYWFLPWLTRPRESSRTHGWPLEMLISMSVAALATELSDEGAY